MENPKKPTWVFMQVDTAGNQYFSEFEEGNTKPIRSWVERPMPYHWDLSSPPIYSNRGDKK